MNQVVTEELRTEIKNLIMETLGITGIKPEEIDDDKPLFGGENALTLDSVDALEIIMAIQRKYNLRIADQNLARSVIRSINSIAEFLVSEQGKHS
ncbi:MAG: phosphopantetheine-binding protein [Bacteroidetes bacterium]|nr:phosphopantetheine-binding protein [Bacteroidota bacterium]